MPQSDQIHRLVASNFGPVAANYATSAGHANKQALAELVELIVPASDSVMLDIATGAGNVALAFSPYVAKVVAFDLTPAMLEQTLRSARERRIGNVEAVQGVAEELPFENRAFDLVTVRLAPHHYADIVKAVNEMARVLRPGGKLLIVDTTVPEDDELDREINEIEWIRDDSHVRNYRPSEWRRMVESAGLQVLSEEIKFYTEGFEMDFDAWVERIRTPAPNVAELRRRLHSASPKLAAAIKLHVYGDRIGFVWPQLVMVAQFPMGSLG
ncbi:MAG: methyltransferase domain-containing protein [Fimbriimonas sp.]|nr:methyltransferase domain-containing protein [Fimbriimonas sp.]